jgi:hypothetical protein
VVGTISIGKVGEVSIGTVGTISIGTVGAVPIGTVGAFFGRYGKYNLDQMKNVLHNSSRH